MGSEKICIVLLVQVKLRNLFPFSNCNGGIAMKVSVPEIIRVSCFTGKGIG